MTTAMARLEYGRLGGGARGVPSPSDDASSSSGPELVGFHRSPRCVNPYRGVVVPGPSVEGTAHA